MGRHRDRQAPILFRVVHQPVGHALQGVPIHFVPAPDKIGALVIKADVHELVIPGLAKGIVRDLPFAQFLVAIGTSKGVLDRGLLPFQVILVLFFAVAHGNDRPWLPAGSAPPFFQHKGRKQDH